MNKTRAAIISVLAVASLAGTAGVGDFRKVADCTFREVKIEYQDSYYCGSRQQFDQDLQGFIARLKSNELNGFADAGFGQLMIKNRPEVKAEIKKHFTSKYNAASEEFDGTQFGGDISAQSIILMELANDECSGGCTVDLDHLTRDVYNIINN